MRIRVDLPQPDGPISAPVSPFLERKGKIGDDLDALA